MIGESEKTESDASTDAVEVVLLSQRRSGSDSEGGISVSVARVDLWKRRWRGTASDGTPVAVDLAGPAGHGDLLSGGGRTFLVLQLPEEVVGIPLPESGDLAAKIGWYLGNRHIPIEVRDGELVMEMFPTLTDSLERIGIPYQVRNDVLNCNPHSVGHRH